MTTEAVIQNEFSSITPIIAIIDSSSEIVPEPMETEEIVTTSTNINVNSSAKLDAQMEDNDDPPHKKARQSSSEDNNEEKPPQFCTALGVKFFDDDLSLPVKHPVRNLRSKIKKVSESKRENNDEIPEHLLEEYWEEKEETRVKSPKVPSEFDRFDDLEELLTYPLGSDNIIRMEDYKCLDHRELLSDVIIDFCFRYLHLELLTEEQRSRVHICGTHFYNLYSTSANFTGWKDSSLKAPEKRYHRIQDLPCNQGVDIFEKDFVVFPCHDKEHWFLAIACFIKLNGAVTFEGNIPVPSEDAIRDKKDPNAGQPLKQSCIMIFDSVKGSGGRRNKAIFHLRNFINSEYKEKHQADFAWEKTSLAAFSVNVSFVNSKIS